MKTKLLAAGATLALALLGTTAAQAGQFHRQTTIYGPAGVTTGSTDRVCYDYTCTLERQITGPYGYSAGRSASTTQVEPGVYERDVLIYGPYGGTVSRGSTITVNR